jgi:hypothetical protein
MAGIYSSLLLVLRFKEFENRYANISNGDIQIYWGASHRGQDKMSVKKEYFFITIRLIMGIG